MDLLLTPRQAQNSTMTKDIENNQTEQANEIGILYKK